MQLILEFFRAVDADDPYAFRSGTQEYMLRSEGGGAQTAVLEWDDQLLSDLQALRLPGRDPADVQRLGDALRQFLAPMGWAQHEADIAKAVQQGEPVLITVRSSAAELYALPWELLTLKATGQPIGELPGVLFRYAWPETRTAPEQPSPRPEGGRILLAWSAAAGTVPAAAHRDAIEKACARGFHPFDAEKDVLPALSISRLHEALEQARRDDRTVSVLHILCHGARRGQTFGLCWDAEQDGEDNVVVDAAQLRRLLAPHAGFVRLVVLCACDGGNTGELGNHLGSVAQALHQAGMQAVVASRFPLSVAGSVRFCEALYSKLLSTPASLESAFVSARKELSRDVHSLDWASLQLYARAEDGDDTRPIIFRPYRGLLAFAPQHTRFFFGRDAERQELQADLEALRKNAAPRFLVVAGASGTGKSSVVLSGLIPDLLGPQQDSDPREHEPEALRQVLQRLGGLLRGRTQSPAVRDALQVLDREADTAGVHGQTWQVAVLRPGSDPMGALAAALAERKDSAHPFLLVVDQFEEIFTHTSDAAVRQSFAGRLWSLSRENAGVHCIITVRVDFLGQCGEVVLDESGLRLDRVAYNEAHRVFIAQMGPEQLTSAIENPARLVGLRLEHGLARRMIAEVGGEPGALPLLEYTLDLLWQRRRGSVLTAEGYAELGGVIGALQQRANQLLASLTPEQQKQARRILVHLVSIGDNGTIDTRRHVPLSSLREREPAESTSFDTVLSAFVQARLLVQSEQAGQVMIEVAHEALIRKWEQLRKWVEEDRGMLVELQEVEQWVKQWQEYKVPLQGDQLGYAARVLEKYPTDVSPAGRAMIEASQHAQKEAHAHDQELARQREEQQQRELVAAKRLAEEAEKLRLVQEQAASDARAAAARQRRRTRIAGALGFVAILAAVGSLFLFRRARNSAQQAQHRLVQVYQEQGIQELERDEPLRALVYLSRAYSQVKQPGPPLLEPLAHAALAADIQLTSLPVADAILMKSFAFSPDGSHLVTAGAGPRTSQGIIRIIDAAKGRALAPIIASDGAWQSVAFDVEGNQLITVSKSGFIAVHDIGTGKTVRTLDLKQKLIPSIAISPDGNRLLSAVVDEPTARIWDTRSGAAVLALIGHRGEIRGVGYCNNGSRVFTIGADRTLRIWDATSGQELLMIQTRPRLIRRAALSPDGSRLITLSADKAAELWDATNGRTLGSLRGHQDAILDAAFSADGARVVTASSDQTVKIWDATSGQLLLNLHGHRGPVERAAFSPDGTRVATLGQDDTIKLWDARSNLQLAFKSPERWFNDAAFSPDGVRIATAGADNIVRVWDAYTGKELMTLTGHQKEVVKIAFSPDGSRLISSSKDKTAKVWELRSGAAQLGIGDLCYDCRSAAFSADGTRVLVVGPYITVRILDATSGAELLSREGMAAVLSADAKRVITALWSAPLQAWDIKSGLSVLTLNNQDAIDSIALSPDGTRIVATIDSAKTAKIIDARSGKQLATLQEHHGQISTIVFSPDNTRVVTASADGTAKIWNALTGRSLYTLKVGGEVTSAALNANGTRLVTTSRNGTAKVWDVALEARSPEQIAALVSCRTPFFLDQEGRLLLNAASVSAESNSLAAFAPQTSPQADDCSLPQRPLHPFHKLERARSLQGSVWIAVSNGNLKLARLHGEQALAVFAEQRWPKEQAETLLLLSEVARRQDSSQEAQSLRDQAHALYQATVPGGAAAEAEALVRLAQFKLNTLHDPDSALLDLDRARALQPEDVALLARRAEVVLAIAQYDVFFAELPAVQEKQEPAVRAVLTAYAWAASLLTGRHDHKQRARAFLDAYRAWPDDQPLRWQFSGILHFLSQPSTRPAEQRRVLKLVRMLNEGSDEDELLPLLGIKG